MFKPRAKHAVLATSLVHGASANRFSHSFHDRHAFGIDWVIGRHVGGHDQVDRYREAPHFPAKHNKRPSVRAM